MIKSCFLCISEDIDTVTSKQMRDTQTVDQNVVTANLHMKRRMTLRGMLLSCSSQLQENKLYFAPDPSIFHWILMSE
ncbi:hypothetical protein EUGRSUZ_E04237 [Eucalyptus grandis]|uniref:Uncharacterized protein n=2 Tax=Eucalyptus grandis TaxID=71139 RepID=A0ACC3L0V4_EUCGR|nr:hypothetical protein EUGRSUZ_E04237 [Eucalyptus grandis]